MRTAKRLLGILVFLVPLVILATMANVDVIGRGGRARQAAAEARAPSRRVVIAASRVFDGRGRVLRDTRIVVAGSKIAAIDAKSGPVDYDLRGLTVLPGWIDAHVHITWGFGKDGKNVNSGGTTQEDAYRTR